MILPLYNMTYTYLDFYLHSRSEIDDTNQIYIQMRVEIYDIRFLSPASINKGTCFFPQNSIPTSNPSPRDPTDRGPRYFFSYSLHPTTYDDHPYKNIHHT